MHGDVRDRISLDAALDGVDVVCHQAAKVGLGVDFQDAPDYVSSNDAGTAHVLAGMDRHGIGRLVVASSMVVYGEGAYTTASGEPVRPPARRRADLDAGEFDPIGPDGKPLLPGLIDESAALDPRNVYAQTKVAQEHLASSWSRATGGRAIALRYHNVYGPGMPANTPYAGVASLFRSALARGEAPRVFEDGRQRRDFVHVDDVAGANAASIAATADLPAETFRAYNVGSGIVHTIGEMAAAIAGPEGPQPVVTGEYRLGDVRHVTASSDRIAAELGGVPRSTSSAACGSSSRRRCARRCGSGAPCGGALHGRRTHDSPLAFVERRNRPHRGRERDLARSRASERRAGRRAHDA